MRLKSHNYEIKCLNYDITLKIKIMTNQKFEKNDLKLQVKIRKKNYNSHTHEKIKMIKLQLCDKTS